MKFKKVTALALCVAMSATALAGCGSKAATTDSQTAAPAESTAAETTESTAEAQTETADAQTEAGRQFVVGFDAEFPPYGYKDDLGDDLGRGIPFHDENNGGDGSLSHGRGQRGDDGAVFHIYLVAGTVAHAGHIAAGNRRGD